MDRKQGKPRGRNAVPRPSKPSGTILAGNPLPAEVTGPLGIDLADLFLSLELMPDNGMTAWLAANDLAIAAAKIKKLRLLAGHLGIDVDKEGGWEMLALRLAEAFLPGFSMEDAGPKGPGRPKGTGGTDKRRLYEEVEALRKRKRLSVSGACAVLAKRPEWRGSADSVEGRAASLETRYHEYKQELEREAESRQKVRLEMAEIIGALQEMRKQ